MQENEKYGVVITAITQYFKKGMQELSKIVKDFGKEAKEETTIAPKFVDTGYQKQIDYVKQQMEEIQDTLDFKKNNKSQLEPIDIAKLEAEYEDLSYKLEDLVEKQEEFENGLDDTDKTAQKTKSTLSTLFDGSISKIKRFTYYLLGARSVFSLFMRYRSIYYQYNEEMQYQSELSQNAIALSLAPAFELLGNIITYASIGLAKFIELLTGVNVLSKVTTKGIRDYNKSLKETQTLVSGIDEITNLTNPQNLGLASQYQALADFQKKVAEVEKFFSENKWITDIVKGLKDIIEKAGGAEGALKLLGGVAVMGAIGKLIGTAGTAGSGLLGIVGLLTTIAGVYTIYLQVTGNEEYKKIMDTVAYTKDEKKNFDKILKTIDKLADKLKKLDKNSTEYKNTIKKINEGWGIINSTIQLGHEDIINNTNDAEELAKKLWNITNKSSYKSTFDISKEIGLIQAQENAKSFHDKIEDWFTGTDKNINKTKSNLMQLYDEEKTNLSSIDKSVINLQENIKKLTNKNYKIKLTTEIIAKIGEGATSTAQALSQAILKSIRGYASGLDYVPYDNYPALLHKGEAVVPAKYNPSIHSEGNDYTNSLLETLILKVDDLASRPNVFEIDGQQFANATYGLYDSERKRQGYIEGVVR